MTIHYVTTAAELTSILASSSVSPGDEIQLRAGTYTATVAGAIGGSSAAGKGVFQVKINGTSGSPIIICPVPGHRVRINGGLEIVAVNASYIHVKYLEIAPTPTTRTFAGNPDYPDCIYCTAVGCKIIGNVLHDGQEGISLFATGGADVLDNVIYNCGWHDGSNWRGTSIYTHNHPGGTINITHNAFHNAFGADVVALWSASSNNVQDYDMETNVMTMSNNGVLLCSSASGLCEDNTIDYNHMYNTGVTLGASNTNNGLLYFRNNRVHTFYVPLNFWYQNSAVITDNLFFNEDQLMLTFRDGLGTVDNTMNDNEFRGPDYNDGVYDYDLATTITWATWQGRGYDVDSTFSINHPSTNETFVYTLDNGDALAVIWNWAGDDEVAITLPSTLSSESWIRARNTADYYHDYQIQPVSSGQISINMEAAGRSIAIPEGTGAPTQTTTFPEFGAFYLEAENNMSKTLFDLTYQTAIKLGEVVEGVATGGSTTTLIDTNARQEADDVWGGNQGNTGTAWILYDYGGTGAPPQGEYSRISDFANSTSTATLLDALSASVGAGDQYGIAGPRYPLHGIIGAINKALRDLGDVGLVDTTSLDTAAAQTEYTLPFVEGRLTKVMYQGQTSDANDNRWIPVKNWRVAFGTTGSGRTLYLPQLPASRDIWLEYRGPHPQLRLYDDKLNETIPEQLIVTMAALDLAKREIMRVGKTDPRLNDRVDLLREQVAEARASFEMERPRPDQQLLNIPNYSPENRYYQRETIIEA